MAIEVYCEDVDLLFYRPNILSLGVTDWEDQRKEAFELINRIVDARWYREIVRQNKFDIDPDQTPFTPDYVEEDQLKRLACYKTLELAYMKLAKEGPDEDGFERNMKNFRQLYNEELDIILAVGITYDWDASGSLTYDERYLKAPRRLKRS